MYIQADKKNMVRRLKKSLYGLKQAPRPYLKFGRFMMTIGFTWYNDDHCSYFKKFINSYITLLLYMDDMLVTG